MHRQALDLVWKRVGMRRVEIYAIQFMPSVGRIRRIEIALLGISCGQMWAFAIVAQTRRRIRQIELHERVGDDDY